MRCLSVSQNGKIFIYILLYHNRVTVIVRRLGGGFGGKLSRGVQVACGAALVANEMDVPCRFILPLDTNLTIAGRRLPCQCEYEVVYSVFNFPILNESKVLTKKNTEKVIVSNNIINKIKSASRCIPSNYSRGNLVLRHCVPHFLPNSGGIAY